MRNVSRRFVQVCSILDVLEPLLDQQPLDVLHMWGRKVGQTVTSHAVPEDLNEGPPSRLVSGLAMAIPPLSTGKRIVFHAVPRLGLDHGVAWRIAARAADVVHVVDALLAGKPSVIVVCRPSHFPWVLAI